MTPFRILCHLPEQLFGALNDRMVSTVITITQRESVTCLPCAVRAIAYQILLIQLCVHSSGVFVLEKASDPGVKVRHALHLDQGVIILCILRKPACDIQHIHL